MSHIQSSPGTKDQAPATLNVADLNLFLLLSTVKRAGSKHAPNGGVSAEMPALHRLRSENVWVEEPQHQEPTHPRIAFITSAGSQVALTEQKRQVGEISVLLFFAPTLTIDLTELSLLKFVQFVKTKRATTRCSSQMAQVT